MVAKLDQYSAVAGEESVAHLRQLAAPLRGLHMVHVNSTRQGGGVAEILERLVPLMNELGIDAKWEVVHGNSEFYACTKQFHNGLQGNSVEPSVRQLRAFEQVNQENAERLRATLESADIVFIHDPQPAPLLKSFAARKGKWVWRCHIDVSRPQRTIWKYLRQFVEAYDASIWSLATFAQPLGHPQFLIAPSIDPLSEKNTVLDNAEINATANRYDIDRSRPLIVQISRFDRFKDPLGVVQAYRLAKHQVPGLQLVLAGGGATDDPEGETVLSEVRAAAGDDPDIHVILLPPDAHRTINALQRLADVAVQKSLKEGFGLTVTESMWKHKPVLGGDAGGIRLQVIDHHTGFLVSTPEGVALRLRYLLDNRDRLREMGLKAHEFVRHNFLLTRHLREYLTIMVAVMNNVPGQIELAS
ncbi:glycosyltransferase [candidate division KSB1 bacterium]|nr:glycosyltransferase [candidate division KSB1 bacterium]